MLTSATYQQNGDGDARREKIDPDNRLLWHRSPQRLEAEIIRDAILAVSGRLDETQFGPGSLDEGMRRRSIYFTSKRSKLIPMMVQFDAPDSLQGMGRRPQTTIAPQALLLLNNTQVRADALGFAKRIEAGGKRSADVQIQEAFRIALGRLPEKSELRESIQ